MHWHRLCIPALVGLAAVLTLTTWFCLAAQPAEQTQRLKKTPSRPVEPNDKIDYTTVPLELSVSEEPTPIGGGLFKIVSKTFLPPEGRSFDHFPDNTWVDVEKNPDSLLVNKNVDNLNNDQRIKVWAMETKANTAGQFPMKCEGNLSSKGRKGGEPDHWAVLVLVVRAEHLPIYFPGRGWIDDMLWVKIDVQANNMGMANGTVAVRLSFWRSNEPVFLREWISCMDENGVKKAGQITVSHEGQTITIDNLLAPNMSLFMDGGAYLVTPGDFGGIMGYAQVNGTALATRQNPLITSVWNNVDTPTNRADPSGDHHLDTIQATQAGSGAFTVEVPPAGVKSGSFDIRAFFCDSKGQFPDESQEKRVIIPGSEEEPAIFGRYTIEWTYDPAKPTPFSFKVNVPDSGGPMNTLADQADPNSGYDFGGFIEHRTERLTVRAE